MGRSQVWLLSVRARGDCAMMGRPHHRRGLPRPAAL